MVRKIILKRSDESTMDSTLIIKKLNNYKAFQVKYTIEI